MSVNYGILLEEILDHVPGRFTTNAEMIRSCDVDLSDADENEFTDDGDIASRLIPFFLKLRSHFRLQSY
jgi:hypothetical protein